MTARPRTAGRLDELRSLHRRAVAESSAGRPVQARRLLADVLEGGLDAGADTVEPTDREARVLRAAALITLAKVESELHGAQTGLAELDVAARYVADEGLDEVATALHNQRGVLLLRAGRMIDGAQELIEAENWFATASPLDRANVLLNRATARMALGQMRAAADDLTRCSVVAEGSGLRLLESMALHNLGYLRFLLGDLPAALATMEAAERIKADDSVIPLLDRGRVLAEAGLTREADDVLAEAGAIFRRSRLTQDLGEVEFERARCALVAGDVSAARRLAASARNRFRRRGSDGWRRNAELVLLQGDLEAGRPGSRLIAPALRLQREFADAGSDPSARTAGLIAVQATLSAGRVDDARSLLATLGRGRKDDPIIVRLRESYVRASVERAAGRPRQASRHARSGLAELTAYQARFGGVELQTAAAIHGRHLAEIDVALALDGGRADEVFAAAERSRAVSNRLPVVRPPADAETADLMSELRQVAESLHGSALAGAGEMAALQRRRRDLERRIAARGWALSGTGDVAAAADPDDVRAALRDDTELVTYVQSGGRLLAVVLSGSRLTLHDLAPAAAVLEQVRRVRADLDGLSHRALPDALRVAVAASLQRSLAELDAALIVPIQRSHDRLVVSTTGTLAHLPWGMLPALRAVPVVVTPSATSWLGATRTRGGRRRGVVAIAGPAVPSAARELRSVARVWPSAQLHQGGDAGRRSFVGALRSAAVLHVAAHGRHQTENPLFSSVRLADGVLFAHELDQTRKSPEHVVLSACELGLATVRPGDEGLGLTSVLLRLGTRSVVAGVARVGDEIAARTMAAYHRRLARGSDTASALAEALTESTRPGDLAPFVCFGATWAPPTGPA